jgi:hypothetical protein
VITLFVGFACLAGPLAFLLGAAPLLMIGAGAWGPRRVFAWLALVDLIVPAPLLLFFVYGVQQVGDSLVWRLPVYLVFVTAAILMLAGCAPPDWLLPVKGRWARRLWALIIILALVAVPGGDLLISAAREEPRADLWIAYLILIPLLSLYLWPLWDVLARGWTPRDE